MRTSLIFSFEDFSGQDHVINNLKIFVEAANQRNEALDHTLFHGPPGLGKTTLANILAKELDVEIKVTSGPVLDKPADLAGLLTNLQERDVLFIDEIHTIVGAGGAMGSLDASNMFKPALARGEIQCIGATTIDEYRKYIEKDGALERRFQKIIVEPTTINETIEILQNIKHKYEDHHNVKYTYKAIEACVKLTDRYINDRNLPDKAIDALDEAGSRIHITNMDVPKSIIELEEKLEEVKERKNSVVKNQKYEEAARLRDDEKKIEKELLAQQIEWEEELKKNKQTVTEDSIIEVVSLISGVPLKKIDNKKNNLNFDLLSDEEIKVLKKYKVWAKKKFMGREFMGIVRTTFLIDKKGKIIKIWNNVKVKDHAKEVLETLQNIVKK